MVVVLPAPLTPTMKITAGLPTNDSSEFLPRAFSKSMMLVCGAREEQVKRSHAGQRNKTEIRPA